MTPLLSKQQCNAMRGLAIISIMLHNYCHAFPFAIGESEFDWRVEETAKWGDYLHNIDSYFLIQLFSTFGFIGVTAFMFLGGYGLVRKYEASSAPFATGKFIFNQYKKLLALVLVPLLAFVVMQLVSLRSTFATPWSVLAQLGMVINFIKDLKIVPFPYWYLGMMMQLYIIYALIVHPTRKRGSLIVPLCIIIVGYTLHLMMTPDTPSSTFVRLNAPVAFLPFAMGVLAARYGKQHHISTTAAALMIPVLLTGIVVFSFNYHLWGLNYGLGAMLFVCLAIVLRGRLLTWTVKVGEVSALVFVLHPLTRFMIKLLGEKYFPDWVHSQMILYILTTIVAVYVYRKLKINERTLKIFNRS